jgi:hypothetical protein
MGWNKRYAAAMIGNNKILTTVFKDSLLAMKEAMGGEL